MGDVSTQGDGRTDRNIFRLLIYRLSKVLEVVAGVSLLFIMVLTTCDVIGRAFARPIIGTYEIVSFGAGVLVGFSLPITTLEKGHVYVDFLYQKFSAPVQKALEALTNLLGIALFLGAGYNLLKMASDLQRAGEVSSTLQLPYYAIAYGIGFSCLTVCLVLSAELVTVIAGRNHE
jgi:TRAP-type C4-dicarboxylate transport system permease small subunit